MIYSKPQIKEQEILLKAIKLAIKNGWKPEYHFYKDKEEATKVEIGVSDVTWVSKDRYQVYEDMYHLLFNHEFAKSLWGGEEVNKFESLDMNNFAGIDVKAEIKYAAPFASNVAWQYRLQQMVIAKNIYEYLDKNI